MVEPDLGSRMTRSDPHAATMTGEEHAAPSVEIGSVLASRYEVLSILGAGAMGTVLRVHDRELDETLALKVLHLPHAPWDVARDSRAIDRFRQEVKLARRVTHKNVARTFELGESGGLRFITMELVEGESLARLIERRKVLAPSDAVPILAGICDGLAAAHAASVIHRDIKPENVLIESTGRVVVTDFGIAKQHDPGDASRTQQIVGTPFYMAPEQVEGIAATPRSDLYALGVVAYEMLVGEPPWTGGTVAQVAFRRIFEPPPDPRQKRELPSALADAVMRCMARQPADRFESALAVRDALVHSIRASVAPQPAPAAARTTGVPRQRSLVVLSLRHAALGAGGVAEDAYLAEGVADDLSDSLASVKGVRVLSRSAAPEGGDPREVGKRLGLTHVIEGTFRRQGDSCRISLRLVEVESGFVAWTQRFDLAADKVLSAQDEIARAVTEALGLEAEGGARRASPSDAIALDLYLRARRHYNSFSLTDVRASIALLDEAIRHAPDNALLHAGLALALQREAASGGADGASMLRAENVVADAVRLGPELGEAHLAHAQMLINAGRPAEAARAARLAVKFSPSLAEAHEMLGRLLLEAGRVPDAVRRLDVAERLDPGLAHVPGERARLAALEGDWARMRQIFDTNHHGASTGLRRLMMELRFAAWQRDEAAMRRAYDTFNAQRGGDSIVSRGLTNLMDALVLGKRPEGSIFPPVPERRMAQRLEQWSLQLDAEVAGYFGDHAHAALCARRAAEAGLFDLLWLDRCPLLEGARTHEDFARAREIVQRTADAIVDAVWA